MSGSTQILLAGGFESTFRLTVSNMANETGIVSYYGFSTQAYRNSVLWTPSGGGDIGAVSPTYYGNLGVSANIGAMVSVSDSPGEFYVVLQGTLSSNMIRSIKVQLMDGTYSTAALNSASSTGGGAYTLYRFVGLSSLWLSSAIGSTRNIILVR